MANTASWRCSISAIATAAPALEPNEAHAAALPRHFVAFACAPYDSRPPIRPWRTGSGAHISPPVARSSSSMARRRCAAESPLAVVRAGLVVAGAVRVA